MKIQVNGIDYSITHPLSFYCTLFDSDKKKIADVYFDIGVQAAIVEYYDENGNVTGDEYSVDLYHRFGENIEENLANIGEWLAATHPEAQ